MPCRLRPACWEGNSVKRKLTISLCIPLERAVGSSLQTAQTEKFSADGEQQQEQRRKIVSYLHRCSCSPASAKFPADRGYSPPCVLIQSLIPNAKPRLERLVLFHSLQLNFYTAWDIDCFTKSEKSVCQSHSLWDPAGPSACPKHIHKHSQTSCSLIT